MPVVAAKSYVEYRKDAYWVEGTRISLNSVVYAFRSGLSPESIVQSFPLLTILGDLRQVIWNLAI
jgi:uncharacterized protein (DUF433 family)